MKFPQVPVGQRFRWRGAAYRKTGPLTADAENDGAATMIPRSAVIESIEPAAAAGETIPGAPLHPEAVAEALDELIGRLAVAADQLAEPDAEHLRAELDASRRAFIDRVGL